MGKKIETFTRWITEKCRKMLKTLRCFKGEEEEAKGEFEEENSGDNTSVVSFKAENKHEGDAQNEENDLKLKAFARDYVVGVIAIAREKYLQEMRLNVAKEHSYCVPVWE